MRLLLNAIVAALAAILTLIPVHLTHADTPAVSVKWVTLDGAMDEARRSDKKILLDVYTDSFAKYST